MTHWRWYLPGRKQERVQIRNLFQDLSQKQIYMKYALPVRQYSHRNIKNHFFQKVVQYSQEKDGEDLHYRVLGFNESSTENDMKNLSAALRQRWTPQADGGPRTYKMSFPAKGGPRRCPVTGCPGDLATRTAMRVHFLHRHVHNTVVILEEGNLPFPRCTRCN